LARSKSSGRGFSGDLNIIDETFAYTATQHAALMPTMSARKNPQIIYTSTPPLDGDTGEVLFDLRKRALAGGDESFGYRDWGAAGCLDELAKIKLDDRAMWAQANPALGIRITEETIRRERRSLGQVEFARERCGIWPLQRTGGGIIDMDKWTALLHPGSIRSGECALGISIAPDRLSVAIGLYGHGLLPGETAPSDTAPLGHLQLVTYYRGTGQLMARIIELSAALAPIAIGLSRATYASLESELTRAGLHVSTDVDHPQRRDLLVLNGLDMAAACGHMIDAVRDGTMRVKPDPISPEILDSAVAGAQVRSGGDSLAWSHQGDADITPLVAVTCARFAFVTRVNLITDATKPFFGAWR
jgi:hypothetical protein